MLRWILRALLWLVLTAVGTVGVLIVGQRLNLVTLNLPGSFHRTGTADPEKWFHVLPIGDDEFGRIATRVYDRIEKTDKPRRDPKRLDTIIEYGPGHWTYEWEKEAEPVLAQARSAEQAGDKGAAAKAYMLAAKLFATGSYPHIRSDKYAMAALEKSQAAYQAGARLLPGVFRVLAIPYEGKSFQAYLFLPPGNGPFPLLVASPGSDVVKEQGLHAFLHDELAKRGIGLLLLDLPGIGGSGAYNLTPDSGVLHVAAVQFMRADPAIDPKRVAAMGLSFGGHAAARILFRPELNLSGVIYACGPLNRAFMLSPWMFGIVPPLQIAGVRDRIGLAPDASNEEMSARLQPFSFKNRNLLNGGTKVSTPLLILTNDADPVAPISDLPLISEATTRAKTVILHQQGHCPDMLVAGSTAAAWLDGLFNPAATTPP